MHFILSVIGFVLFTFVFGCIFTFLFDKKFWIGLSLGAATWALFFDLMPHENCKYKKEHHERKCEQKDKYPHKEGRLENKKYSDLIREIPSS